MKQRSPCLLIALHLALLTASCGGSGGGTTGPPTPTPSFERTESRVPCDDYNPFRNFYFGELHAHSAYSADAFLIGTAALPADIYRFAMGEPIGLAAGTVQLRRPLDFAAVTDHAEHFALPHIGLLGGNAADSSFVWRDLQDAAERFYDRSAACKFTTFIAYEYASPGGFSLHRNVIFRNENVPPLPTSGIDAPTPQGLWAALRAGCLDTAEGCDVMAIPHNSNLSNGMTFDPQGPFGGFSTRAEAAARAAIEPLVEVYQAKGDSECRLGVLTNDEVCNFEKLSRIQMFGESSDAPVFEPLSFVRNVLKEGLVQEELLGANPFQLGMIGSSDTHRGIAGATNEDDYRHTAPANVLLSRQAALTGIEANPGGLAVVWAEDNSRDALFAALRRREVYATSGTRPIVRFFAGDYPSDLCESGNFVERGYADGAPMGSALGPGDFAASGPSFAVLALRDAGSPSAPAAALQRVQVIKGWIDADGEVRERVFDVAGDHASAASVEPATCGNPSDGFDSLCTVWRDPTFNAGQRSFYYVRVLETPTCRWSTHLCNQLQINCADPGAPARAFEACCDESVPKAIQERAWTSPIWYLP